MAKLTKNRKVAQEKLDEIRGDITKILKSSAKFEISAKDIIRLIQELGEKL